MLNRQNNKKYALYTKSRYVILFITFFILLIACTRKIHQTKELPLTLPVKTEQKQFHRGMWVRAVSIASPDSIQRIIDVAHKLAITDLYVQVVVAGYAYYKSRILPRSQYLAEISGPEYDPLDSLTTVCKNNSIKVHAWLNTMLIWSLKNPPDSANHIFYTRPEWFIKDVNRKSMYDYSYEEWLNNGLEGLYLDPENQEVREHITNISIEIVKKYSVAGIHLDFIRFPGTLWGLPDSDTSMIFAGLQGHTVRWLNLVRYPQLSFLSRWLVWHNWKINSEKEKAILEIIKQVHKTINNATQNSKCVLSTAIFPNPSLAIYRFAQNWPTWGKYIDYPMAMSYTEDLASFSHLFDFTFAHRPDAVFGIGFLWPDIEIVAYCQVSKVIQNQGAGISFFDFTSIDTMVDLEKFKGEVHLNEKSLVKDTTNYAEVTGVFADLAKQDFVNRGRIMLTLQEDSAFAKYLLSLSLNTEHDLKSLGLSRPEFLNKIMDDICAFKYLDSKVFPVGDQLIEPERREIYYEFVPWQDGDTLATRTKAEKVKKLITHIEVYPNPLDKLSRAAFKAKKGKREKCITNTGIYVFEVRKIHKGSKKKNRQNIKKELLPVYLYWTIHKKLIKLME